MSNISSSVVPLGERTNGRRPKPAEQPAFTGRSDNFRPNFHQPFLTQPSRLGKAWDQRLALVRPNPRPRRDGDFNEASTVASSGSDFIFSFYLREPFTASRCDGSRHRQGRPLSLCTMNAGTLGRLSDSAAVGTISKNHQLRNRGGSRMSAKTGPNSPSESVSDAGTKPRADRHCRPERIHRQRSSGDNRLSLAHARRPTQADWQKG